MSWAALDKLSVAKPGADGTQRIVIKDERSFAQIAETRHASALIAIARVAYARAVLADKYGGKGRVIYVTPSAPPGFLVEAVCAAGATVFDGKTEHSLQKPPEVSLLLDGAFCDLAIAVRRRVNVRTFTETLDVVEWERRRRPIAKTDLVAHAIARFELMAVVGEIAREKKAGKWIVAAGDIPLAIDLGRGKKVAPGAIAGDVAAGQGTLKDLLEHEVPPPALTMPTSITSRILPLLYARERLPHDRIAWELLAGDDADTPEMPVVAYIEEREKTVRWPELELSSAIRAKALANLAAEATQIAIEVVDTPDAKLAVVAGTAYASELILHRPTMQKLEAAIGVPVLYVAMPTRGELIVADGTLEGDPLTAFLMTVEKHFYEAPERSRISTEVVVYHERPLGRVQSNYMDTRRALRRMDIDPDA